METMFKDKEIKKNKTKS